MVFVLFFCGFKLILSVFNVIYGQSLYIRPDAVVLINDNLFFLRSQLFKCRSLSYLG